MSNKKLFKNPKEVFEEQLNDLFLTRKEDDTDTIVRAFSIILTMNNTKNRDMVDLYNLVGMDEFVSIISLFEKRTVVFPSKNEIKESILLALIFYYREVKGLSWVEIKEIVPFDFSSISYSSKLKGLNKYLVEKLREIFSKELQNG